MNMLREFFNYFLSVMLGRRDSLTAFLEPLTMGERYLRWGMETRDIRDFRAAMDHMHLCHDRDAPMASLLIRKYNCIGDITAAAIETLLMNHQRVIEDSVKTENNYREELEIVGKKITQSRDYARKLQDEGSLITAKTELNRISELEESAVRLREMIDTGEGKTEIYESYDEITSDSLRFFRELDHASAMVMANVMLGEDGAETLSNQLRTRMDYLKDRVERANPVNHVQPVEPNAGPPPPAGAKAAQAGARAVPSGAAG